MPAPLNVILLGKSGSGKGTQGTYLVKRFNLRVVSTGDLLRDLMRKGLPVSKRIEEVVSKQGKLAPSWLVEYLKTHEILLTDPAQGILFDGCPRMLEEAKQLDEVLQWNGRANIIALLIDISDDEAKRRLLGRHICDRCGRIFLADAPEITIGVCTCGGSPIKRGDDTPEAISARLAYFKKDVEPVIHYYEQKGVLMRINGERSVKAVHNEIMTRLRQ